MVGRSFQDLVVLNCAHPPKVRFCVDSARRKVLVYIIEVLMAIKVELGPVMDSEYLVLIRALFDLGRGLHQNVVDMVGDILLPPVDVIQSAAGGIVLHS